MAQSYEMRCGCHKVLRGLAFRGGTSTSEEKFSSLGNGNFMGALELLAEYDDFFKTHIKIRGNPGSGRVSYLSKKLFATNLLSSCTRGLLLLWSKC